MGSWKMLTELHPVGEVRVMEFLRLCMGWTLEEVADEMGLEFESFSAAWNGQWYPGDDWLRNLAKVLDWDERDAALLFVLINGDIALRRLCDKLNEIKARRCERAVGRLEHFLAGVSDDIVRRCEEGGGVELSPGGE